MNGKGFKDLSEEQQTTIESTALRIIIILKDSNPDVKFEVFERLNLGAEKLNDQELRNCIYRGNYNRLLKDLAKNQHLLKILGSDKPHNRLADCQLILRFFAMSRNTHLKYKGPMKIFLNREMDKHRNLPEKDIQEMRESFEKSAEMAYMVPICVHVEIAATGLPRPDRLRITNGRSWDIPVSVQRVCIHALGL